MGLSSLTRPSVLQAIEECDSIGRAAFLQKYGFKVSRRYVLLHNGHFYDSKAICGAAHGYINAETAPLAPSDFSGGVASVVRRLEALGFAVIAEVPKLEILGVDGTPAKSTCDLDVEGDDWVLVLHSRGGTKGTPTERNPGYLPALRLVLARLAQHGATISDVVLDTRETELIPYAQRRLLPGCPQSLTRESDTVALAKQITGNAASTSSSGKSATSGNPTKQIRIKFRGVSFPDLAAAKNLVVTGSTVAARVFILTWNPTRWNLSDAELNEVISLTEQGGVRTGRWSTGSRKSGIEPGDHVFLFRQEIDRGLIAHGVATSGVLRGPHWDGSKREANYVDVAWRQWLRLDERMTVDEMKAVTAHTSWDAVLGSGIQLHSEDAAALLAAWDVAADQPEMSANGDEAVGGLQEGAKTTVKVNRYERNRRARKICIQHHGAKCSVCEIDFKTTYGGIGSGFIHVHHVVPIASIGESYKLDPITDLVPVCPNCHAMLHHGVNSPRSVAELRAILGIR